MTVRERCSRIIPDDTSLFLRRFNGWATIVWLVLIIPTLLFWAHSIPWLVFMSIYAIVGAHLSAWQSSRVEVKVDAE